MKRRRSSSRRSAAHGAMVLRDAAGPALPPSPTPGGRSETTMVRTQIYLSRAEHDFLQSESVRRDEPMAAVIRSLIDEKMQLPDEVWDRNPLLDPPVDDPDWKGHEDGAINHDHYVYGSPKKWVKKAGKWVEAPPLPGDYYTNEKSRRAYDQAIERRS